MAYLLVLIVLTFISMLCKAMYSDRRAALITNTLLENPERIPQDIFDEYLKPELLPQTRKYQQLVDEKCSNTTECNLQSQEIKSIANIVWPLGIKKLYLNYNEITELSPKDVRALPKALTHLHLSKNNIQTLDGVVFNDNITHLGLSGSNEIQPLKKTHFPKKLISFGLARMNLSYEALTSIEWGSLTQLNDLNIFCNSKRHMHGVLNLPKSLVGLLIDWYTLQSIMDHKYEDGITMELPNLEVLKVAGHAQNMDRPAIKAAVKQYFPSLRMRGIKFLTANARISISDAVRIETF